MTEVHRYSVVKMLSEAGNRISYDPHGPEVVMASAYDQLKADNERLKAELKKVDADRKACWAEFKVQGRQLDQLKAENEALRREREGKVICDLELFETLRDSANTEADEHRQCMATYRPLRQDNLDSVVKKCDDLLAAMGKGEQS